eukprot:TRINITY_DN25544_c0_g1_i1.p1 TRINITY_DN25544_c0_g1~~TRINITY_DN25544_c0_g1_i1.p1  ORF type:complete len:959 (-),score=132.24 TRINITY_DN25544_c0_g1_i1:302-3178(-)
MNRSRSTGHLRARQQRLNKNADASNWAPEVIGALCGRLPAGDSSLSTPCQACKSIFYPCLCKSEQAKNVRGHRHLRPPRIIEVAEKRRMTKVATDVKDRLGNLSMVKDRSFSHGTNKCRLLVTGAQDRNPLDCGRQHGVSGNVVCRHGNRFVVQEDGASEWSQELEFSAKELPTLLECLDADLKIARTLPILRKVEMEYTCQAEARADLEIDHAPWGFYVKRVTPEGLAYNAGVRQGHIVHALLAAGGATSSLELEEYLPGPFLDVSIGDLGSTASPPQGGAKAAIQSLSSTSLLQKRLDSMNRSQGGKKCSETGNWGAGTGLFCTMAATQMKDQKSLPFPCTVVFNALPKGWQVAEVSDGNGGTASSGPSIDTEMRRLASQSCSAKVRFVLPSYQVVSMLEKTIRYEHVWEKELAHSREGDVQLLMDWTMKSRLSNVQLGFIFKQLTSYLSKELQSFEASRQELEEVLFMKANRLMKLKKDEISKSENPDALRNIRPSIEIVGQEIRYLLQHVPLYYLVELDSVLSLEANSQGREDGGPNSDEEVISESEVDRSRRQVHKILARTCRQRVAKEAADKYHSLRGTSGMKKSTSESALKDRDTAVMEQTLLRAAVSSTGITRSSRRQKSRKGESLVRSNFRYILGSSDSRHKSDAELLKLLASEVRDALDAARDGTLRSNEYLDHSKLHDSIAESHQESAGHKKDGRISLKDFERILQNCGITWSSREDVAQQFHAMDYDGSGFLTIGEVLKTMRRLEFLLRCFNDYSHEQAQYNGGKETDREELLINFTARLLLGDDLVGGPLSKEIPDSNITASSYNLDRSQYGKGEMFRSRLNWGQQPWMASAEDKQPWIQWKLNGEWALSAVLIQGHPTERSWVTHFKLQTSLGADGEWVVHEEEYHTNENSTATAWIPLNVPVCATVVRLFPTKWVPATRGPVLRATLLGLKPEEVDKMDIITS